MIHFQKIINYKNKTMLLNMKLSILRLLFIMSLFLFIPRVSAQDCNTAFPYGRNAYLDGQYQSVPNLLTTCVNEFDAYWATYREEGNRARVFVVYKLITESYYALNDFDMAEAYEDRLINFFDGVYDPEYVLDLLEYTQI
jgi:hypothetical protein